MGNNSLDVNSVTKCCCRNVPSVGQSSGWAGRVVRMETSEMQTGICGGNVKEPLVNLRRK